MPTQVTLAMAGSLSLGKACSLQKGPTLCFHRDRTSTRDAEGIQQGLFPLLRGVAKFIGLVIGLVSGSAKIEGQ